MGHTYLRNYEPKYLQVGTLQIEWVTFKVIIRLKGNVYRQYIWIEEWLYYNFASEVFIQKNCVAEFIRQKLYFIHNDELAF